MLRLKHSLLLGRDLFGYVRASRAWWMLPLVGMLLVVTIATVITQVAAPYTIYTLF
jgi:hypothetical protein